MLIALLLTLATLATTVGVDRKRTSERHAHALRIFDSIIAESTELLDHLASKETLDCSNRNLIHLNTHLLQSRHLREIGLMDEARRLICTTALGRVAEPIKGNYPVHTSRSGLELIISLPLAMAEKETEAMLVMRPPFNVVISPYATGDIYASAGAAWLRTPSGLILLNAREQSGTITEMRARAERRQASSFEMRGLGYELITMAPGLDLVLQSRRSLGAIVYENGLLLPALLAGSLLIASLAYGTITPYIIRMRGLHKRIGFLCDEAHLMLVYQPIFDLATLRPIGCEVLARLKEDKRLWMPDKMIPAIQSAGLERSFDHAVTRKALRELGAHLPPWSDEFHIALNYFPRSLAPDTLVPVLKDALRESGRQDVCVCIEITEHSISSELIPEVQRLKAEGFLIAVDDFGTGYSNLRSVTRLSPQLLKIDRSFVYELEDATLRSNLIPEIVNIARAIDARTVAEGIETLEQARLLAAASVHYGQGYALGRPMELAQFIAFLEEHEHQ